MRTVAPSRAVFVYYLLTFAISWGGVLLVVGGPARLLEASIPSQELFLRGIIVTLAGPPVAGLAMTALSTGRSGFRDLWSQLTTWRVGIRWYAVAILTAPLSVTASLLVLSAASPVFHPGYLAGSESTPGGVVTMGASLALAAGLVTGVMEELGWTGFVTPRLLARRSVVVVGVGMGVLWGAWHLVSNLWGSSEQAPPLPLAEYLGALLFTFLPPFRVLLVWMYSRTGSLLLAMLMHASLVFFWLVSTPPGLTSTQLATWYVVWGAILWLAVAAVVGARRLDAKRSRVDAGNSAGRG